MELNVRKLFEVSKYDELDHGAIKRHYMCEPKKLSDDIKSCFKQIGRVKGASREKWLKASGVLVSKYCESIPKSDIEKYRSLADDFTKNNKNKGFLRFQKEIDEIIDHKLSNLYTDGANSYPEKETIKFTKGGVLVCGEFISNRIAKAIGSYALKKSKSKNSYEQLRNNAPDKNIMELLEEYLEDKRDMQNCTKSTIKEYRLAISRLKKFLDENGISLVDVKYEDAKGFQKYIADQISKDRSNNTIGYLSKFFEYLECRGIINKNPFSKNMVMRYIVNKYNKKRNFKDDEFINIFSGKYKIEKELLDYMRFILHTGLRMEEFMRLDEDSFFEKDGIKLIRVKTAKQKFGNSSEDEVVLHKNIHDLANYDWIDNIKRICKTKNALEHRVNRAIDKVINSKDVSAHRLRGNFVQIIREYDARKGISEFMPNIASALRHTPNESKFMSNKREQLPNITNLMLRNNKSNSELIYSQSSAIRTQIHILSAFDGIPQEYFEYLKSNDLPHLKTKNSSTVKQCQKIKKNQRRIYITPAPMTCIDMI